MGIRDDARCNGLHADGATSGPWRIEVREIEHDPLASVRSALGRRGYTRPGTYTGLIHERRGIVMSDTDDEMRDLLPILWRREARRVVVNGLGLGCVVKGLLSRDTVEHIDVVEIDPDVIALTGPPLMELAAGRLAIHEGDAFTFKFPVGTRWCAAWHDIWDDLDADNLSEYTALKRRYGRRVGWQGAWGEEWIRYQSVRDVMYG